MTMAAMMAPPITMMASRKNSGPLGTKAGSLVIAPPMQSFAGAGPLVELVNVAP